MDKICKKYVACGCRFINIRVHNVYFYKNVACSYSLFQTFFIHKSLQDCGQSKWLIIIILKTTNLITK